MFLTPFAVVQPSFHCTDLLIGRRAFSQLLAVLMCKFTYPDVVRLPEVSYCAMVLAVPVVLELTDRATGAVKLNVVPDGFNPDPTVNPFAEEMPRLARAVGRSATSNRLRPRWRNVL